MLRVALLLVVVLSATLSIGGSSAPWRGESTGTWPRAVTRVVPSEQTVCEDTVMVRVVVGVDGQVREAQVVRSVPRFDAECVKAVKDWRFEPARDGRSHQPTDMRVIIPFYVRTAVQFRGPND